MLSETFTTGVSKASVSATILSSARGGMSGKSVRATVCDISTNDMSLNDSKNVPGNWDMFSGM